MALSGKLFRSSLSGHDLWDLYINSFEKKDNPVFRDPNSSYKNCNHCKNFIRRYGNIVSVDDHFNIITMFDNVTDPENVKTAAALSTALKGHPIQEIFTETFSELNSLPYESCSKNQDLFQLGVASNVKRYNKEEAEKFGVVKEGEIRTFEHVNVKLYKGFVDMSGASEATIVSGFTDAKNVFKRCMDEIPIDTLKLVKDLILQGSLLNGDAHLSKLDSIILLKAQYDTLAIGSRDNWCWMVSYRNPFAKFGNELIGTLCKELAEGKELNEACKAWNMRVDPANYMKASAPITKRQIQEAEKFVEENGYSESFDRRCANMDDIKVSEILHANAGNGKIKPLSIFDKVKSTSTRHKRSEFNGIEEVNIDKFMKDILPTCTSVEAFLANGMEKNMVTLTTSKVKGSKPIFKWTNNYSWTFNGNLAGKSEIKQAVKSAGGRVDGVLRFSMIWNDRDGLDRSDLDAWCRQPDGHRIGYNTEFRRDRGGLFSSCGGQLDLDNTNPGNEIGIENIYFPTLSKIRDGEYLKGKSVKQLESMLR